MTAGNDNTAEKIPPERCAKLSAECLMTWKNSEIILIHDRAISSTDTRSLLLFPEVSKKVT